MANTLLQRLFADTCPASEQLTSLTACINSLLDLETGVVTGKKAQTNLIFVSLGIKSRALTDSQ